MIAGAMTAILGILLITVRFFRKNELEKCDLEAKYGQAILSARSSGNSTGMNDTLKKLATEYGAKLGLNEAESSEMLAKDLGEQA